MRDRLAPAGLYVCGSWLCFWWHRLSRPAPAPVCPRCGVSCVLEEAAR